MADPTGSASPWHLPTSRNRGQQAHQDGLQGLPDRLLPHRHRRGADRRRQALPPRGHRPHQQVRLCPTGRERHPRHSLGLPRSPCCRRALPHPHDLDRQRHPGPLRAALRQRPNRPLHDPHVRHAMPGTRHRAPLHQDQSSMDQRPGRADEPNHQARDGQALPRRQSRPAPAAPRGLRRRLQIRPTPQASMRPHALRIHLQSMGYFAKHGPKSLNASPQTRTTKCRDQTSRPPLRRPWPARRVRPAEHWRSGPGRLRCCKRAG